MNKFIDRESELVGQMMVRGILKVREDTKIMGGWLKSNGWRQTKFYNEDNWYHWGKRAYWRAVFEVMDSRESRCAGAVLGEACGWAFCFWQGQGWQNHFWNHEKTRIFTKDWSARHRGVRRFFKTW